MALSDDDLTYIRSAIGAAAPPTDDDLYDAFDRLDSSDAVIAEVLRARLANLLTQPASFSLSGVYSQSNSETIRALTERLAQAEAAAAVAAGTSGVQSGYLVRDTPAR